MRKLIMVLGVVFVIGLIPVTQAYADRDRENPCGKGMMNPCEKKEYMEKRKQMHQMRQRIRNLMEEGMDMWLETVILLKQSATDPQVKGKAAGLEKRLRANINEHKELHKKMHDMRKEHGGHGDYKRHGNPCAPRNPCGLKVM